MPRRCPRCNKEWPDSVVLCPRDGERIMYIESGVHMVDELVPPEVRKKVPRLRLAAAGEEPGVAVSTEAAPLLRSQDTAGGNGESAEESAQLAALEAERRAEESHPRGMVVRAGSQPGLVESSDEATSDPGVAEAEDPTTPSPEELVEGVLVPSAPQVGDVLGNYKLLEVLGEGGMGTVFLGEHTVLKRRDALKVLLPEFCNEPNVVKRFFHEARAVNLIHHPNIIDIKDFVEGENHPPYIVMEYLEGKSLSHLIRHEAPLHPETVVAIAVQVCQALQAVHDEGIAHRDLKPDNIFLSHQSDDTYKVTLLDFGVAKFIHNQDSLLKTLSGAAVGTPEFMAPEQIVGEEVDHRIDVYALGVILYEMLTGRQPFAATTVGELVTAHLTAEPVSPAERLAERGADPIPVELNDTVLECLAKSADERVPSMEALRKRLRRGIGEVTNPLPLPSLADLGSSKPRVRRKWPVVVAVAGVVAVLALGASYGLGLIGAGPSPSSPSSSGMSSGTTGMDATAGPAKTAERRVWVKSVPGGAAIFRQSDGRFLGTTPTSVVLKRGEQLPVRLRLKGYRDMRAQLRYEMTAPLSVVLAAQPDPPMRAAPDAGVPRRVASMRPTMRSTPPTTMRPDPRSMTGPTMRPMDGMQDLGGTVNPLGMKR